MSLIKIAFILIVFVVLICIAPMLVLWSINTIAAASTATLYIPHTFWTYLSVILLILAFSGAWKQ